MSANQSTAWDGTLTPCDLIGLVHTQVSYNMRMHHLKYKALGNMKDELIRLHKNSTGFRVCQKVYGCDADTLQADIASRCIGRIRIQIKYVHVVEAECVAHLT